MHTRLLLADDHPVVLIGARAMIESSRVGEVVGEATSSDELMGLLGSVACDVLVTDYSMPGEQYGDGLRMLETVRRRYPKLPIIILTMVDNIGILQSALAIGILGIIDKSSSMSELPTAIRTVQRGQTFISHRWRDQFVLGEKRSRGGTISLSPRESEVVRLLATGMSVTEISTRLNRAVSTISRQKSDAMRKLGIENEAALFQYAREHGMTN